MKVRLDKNTCAPYPDIYNVLKTDFDSSLAEFKPLPFLSINEKATTIAALKEISKFIRRDHKELAEVCRKLLNDDEFVAPLKKPMFHNRSRWMN